jgi:hypothetical protein
MDDRNHWRDLRAVWGVASLSLMSMPLVRPPESGPSPVVPSCLPLDVASKPNVASGSTGGTRGEVVRTRTTALHMHTRQWIGTSSGKGDSCSELA